MIRLAVRCRPELAEQVIAELVELAPGGVEERHADGYVELAIYGAPGELPELPDLEAAAGDGLIEVTSTEVADDWADRWRKFHRPVAIAGGRIVVRPPWGEQHAIPTSAAAGIEVVVDPGRAFGTGAHPTTRLCLELMLDLADAGRAGGPLVDLGTGSAVLAIAAAKLGWGPVLGVDSEAGAIEAARANAAANGVEPQLRRVNLRTDAVPIAAAVVANLTAPLLIEVAQRIEAGSVAPWPGRNDRPALPQALICSGLLDREAKRVAGAFDRAGFAVLDRRGRGEWAALHLAPAERALSDPPTG